MAFRAEMDQVKLSVKVVEDRLSTWLDEVAALCSTVMELKYEINHLKKKCEDLEGWMRRCNVRILGIPEMP